MPENELLLKAQIRLLELEVHIYRQRCAELRYLASMHEGTIGSLNKQITKFNTQLLTTRLHLDKNYHDFASSVRPYRLGLYSYFDSDDCENDDW